MELRDIRVGVHKLHPDAFAPMYATNGSACFDLRACFPPGNRRMVSYNSRSVDSVIMAYSETEEDLVHIVVPPKDRVLIPTQLIFDIPDGWSMRLHMRSGLAVKAGLTLANGEGVIDSDYTDQVFVAVRNDSDIPIRINHGDRICQGEMVPVVRAMFTPTVKPQQKANRVGGFGSTGKQ